MKTHRSSIYYIARVTHSDLKTERSEQPEPSLNCIDYIMFVDCMKDSPCVSCDTRVRKLIFTSVVSFVDS
jgi:hypothetical protein